MKKYFVLICLLVSWSCFAFPPTPPASGTFSVTDITGQTDDTTPATTATTVLAQGGSLIESTIGQIGTAIGVIDWTADQGATNLNAANFPASFNVPTLLQSFVPQTLNYTESGNLTPTNTWVNLNDTGAAGAKTLDVQDATVNGKYIYYAASGQSAANPLTINMGETTCTNCPAGGFILTDPGQRVELYWNTSIYTVLWPITSMTIIPMVITDADGIALTAAQMNGVVYETSAGDVDIPDGECDAAADVGKWIVVITDDADQNSLTSLDASNQICLGDLTDCLTAGNELDIDGTQVSVMCIAAETWKVTGWLTAVPTDGGAAD
jgi:hypothetical protein